jgi:hypothetical protein
VYRNLDCILNVKSNDSQISKRNSDLRQKRNSYAENRKKSVFSFNLNLDQSLKNYFTILLSIFSIVIPIGIQPQLQANYAFAEINSQSINDEDEYTDEGEITSHSSTSETKSKSNQKDPFGFADEDNKKVKLNIIIPDVVGPDLLPGTQSSTPSSHQIDTHSSEQVHPNSIDRNSSDIDNADGSIIAREDKPATAELSSTDSHIGTLNNNESKNVSEGNSIVSDDKPGTENSQSQLTPQPKYKSYRDYIENSSASKNNDNVIISDDKVGTELNTTNSGINSVIGNPNDNANENLVVSDNQSNTNQLQSTDSQSQLTSQPRYKSYHDYVENNNLSNQDINVTGDTQATGSSSIDSQMDSVNRNVNNNGDDKLKERVILPEDELANSNRSSQIQVDNQSSNSNSTISSQPLSKSYQEFEHNNASKNANNDNTMSSKSTIEPSSATATSSQVSAQSSSQIYGDFNGDGFDDVAIGVPQEDVGSIQDAGAVEVIYGSSSGLSATSTRADQFWTQNSADVKDTSEIDDDFGSSLTSGDFNSDGIDDLAIGVPGENNGAGAVNVIYGSGAGLHALLSPSNQFWTQSTADVNDVSEAGDHFGSSLTSGDFNGDGRDDLAIGVPSENDGGAVNVLYGSSSGVSATSPRADQFWIQNTADVDGASETGDHFGFSLTSGDFNGDGRDDLAIGVPDEGLEGAGLTGSVGGVELIYGSSSGLSATSPRADQFWTQDSANIDDVAENGNAFGFSLTSGDFNDDGKDDLAIGIRWEQISFKSEVGAVEVIYGSSSGLSATSPRADQFWTQDSANINDATESEDQFGYSLSSGDYNGDGNDDLAIGVWWEDVDIGGAEVDDAGGVEVIYGSSSGLSATSPRADQFWTQDSADINDVPERPDEFGLAVYSGDFNGDGKDDLAIGVPQESLGSIENAGGVEVIYGSSSGLSATSTRSDQFWTQNSADVNDASETGDEIGTALG